MIVVDRAGEIGYGHDRHVVQQARRRARRRWPGPCTEGGWADAVTPLDAVLAIGDTTGW